MMNVNSSDSPYNVVRCDSQEFDLYDNIPKKLVSHPYSLETSVL